jgi:hypothetical protein
MGLNSPQPHFNWWELTSVTSGALRPPETHLHHYRYLVNKLETTWDIPRPSEARLRKLEPTSVTLSPSQSYRNHPGPSLRQHHLSFVSIGSVAKEQLCLDNEIWRKHLLFIYFVICLDGNSTLSNFSISSTWNVRWVGLQISVSKVKDTLKQCKLVRYVKTVFFETLNTRTKFKKSRYLHRVSRITRVASHHM